MTVTLIRGRGLGRGRGRWLTSASQPACLRCPALPWQVWPGLLWWPEPWRVLLACLHGGSAVQCVEVAHCSAGAERQDLSRARVVWYRGSSTVCAQGYAYFATRICSHCNGATTRGRRLRDLEGPDLEPILTD